MTRDLQSCAPKDAAQISELEESFQDDNIFSHKIQVHVQQEQVQAHTSHAQLLSSYTRDSYSNFELAFRIIPPVMCSTSTHLCWSQGINTT